MKYKIKAEEYQNEKTPQHTHTPAQIRANRDSEKIQIVQRTLTAGF